MHFSPRPVHFILFLILTSLFIGAPTAQAEPRVVVSIKPIHSLVAAVMKGAGTPTLIIDGASSPHTYALKPSQARALEQADVVFWIGHTLESFLEKPLETIAKNAKSVELIESRGVTQRDFGKDRDHKDEHEKHDDDHKDEHTGHKDEHAEHEDGHEGHGHSGADPHIWLDPLNAKAMVMEISEALEKADPSNSETYKTNAKTTLVKLDALASEISADLNPIKNRPFVVFHDAYRHFEERFGLSASRAVTVSPEVSPGAGRITELRTEIKEMGATCVFSEPQFSPSLVSTLTEGTQASSGVLDPLGSTLEQGPNQYFKLMRAMSGSIKNCLTKTQ